MPRKLTVPENRASANDLEFRALMLIASRLSQILEEIKDLKSNLNLDSTKETYSE